MRRAVLLARGHEIGGDDLVLRACAGYPSDAAGKDGQWSATRSPRSSVDPILETLRLALGNRAVAAAILGIDPHCCATRSVNMVTRSCRRRASVWASPWL